MQGNNSRQKMWAAARNIAAAVGLAMLVYNGVVGIFGTSGATTVHAQTDPFLSRRVDILEQRLYTLESRVNSVSTQAQPSIVSSLPSTTQNELEYQRTEINGLRLRMGEVECGLIRLDERTLPAAERLTRKGPAADGCRQHYGEPIRLSSRP